MTINLPLSRSCLCFHLFWVLHLSLPPHLTFYNLQYLHCALSGTQERVCLITGTVEGITQVHSFIMEKIMEKPDPSAAPPPPLPPGSSSSSASKEGLPYDRHKQVRFHLLYFWSLSYRICSTVV